MKQIQYCYRCGKEIPRHPKGKAYLCDKCWYDSFHDIAFFTLLVYAIFLIILIFHKIF